MTHPHRLLNERPGPRLLVRWSDEETATRLCELVPTALRIDSLAAVNTRDWDALVTDYGFSHHEAIDGDLRVVVVAPASVGISPGERIPVWWWYLGASTVHFDLCLATVFREPVAELGPLGVLAGSELVRSLAARSQQRCFRMNEGESTGQLLPILAARDGEVLAGILRGAAIGGDLGKGEVVLLPGAVVDPVPWVRVLLRRWSEQDPVRFPRSAETWSNDPAWRSPREVELERSLEEHNDRRARVLEELDRELHTLTADRAQAAREADAYERALLTTQGDTLRLVVARCLQDLGFDVKDADAPRVKGDLLEDLQVNASEGPAKTVLVEVRGYRAGAALGDLTRTLRFSKRWLRDHGTEPSALWLIVNHDLGTPPDSRSLALHGHPDDIEDYGTHDRGLVVDTVDLVRLLGAVKSGDLDGPSARRMLLEARGRLTFGRS